MNRKGLFSRMREGAYSLLSRTIFQNEVKEDAGNILSVLNRAYNEGPIGADSQQLERLLKESRLFDVFARLAQAGDLIGVSSFNRLMTETDRNRAVQYARYMSLTNTNIKSAVRLWWAFGLGQHVEVSVTDDKQTATDESQSAEDEVLQEFWTARRNKPVLDVSGLERINRVALDDGELLFVIWYSPVDGKATLRTIPSDQVVPITAPNDPESNLWYMQQTSNGIVCYPDFDALIEGALDDVELPKGAKRLDKQSADGKEIVLDDNGKSVPVTLAVVVRGGLNQIQITHRSAEVAGIAYRGMPMFQDGFQFAKLLDQFIKDRAAVARKAAMFTEKVKVQGGSRAVSAIVDRLTSSLTTGDESGYSDTNPPPPPASDWIENDQVDRQWMDRNTNAQNARYDGMMIAGQMTVSTGVPLHWQGFALAVANRSLAEEMKIPLYQMVSAYSTWLKGIFEGVAQAVLWINAGAKESNAEIASTPVTVLFDTPISATIENIAELIATVEGSVEAEILDRDLGAAIVEELLAIAMNKLGIVGGRETIQNASESQRVDLDKRFAELRDMVEIALIEELKDK